MALQIPRVFGPLVGPIPLSYLDNDFTAIAQTFAANLAELRTVPKTGTGIVYAMGANVEGDGGAGAFWYNAADTTSPDNNGTIIVNPADGGRWYRALSGGPISVKMFGAWGDGIHDDTGAIMAAYSAGFLQLYFPQGIYNYTTLNFAGAIGLTLIGDGAISASILRCTSVGSGIGVNLQSSFDCTIEDLTLDHTVIGFTGYLLDQSHSTSTSTQGTYCLRVTFTSLGFNLRTAKGVNLNQTTGFAAEGCKFVGLLRPIDGQAAAGGSFSNVARFSKCQFASNTGYAFNYPGIGWAVRDCTFEPCADGNHRIVFSDPTLTPWQALTLENLTIFDATTATTSYLNLGVGQGLTIKGGMWAAIAGSATLLNATGAITGVSMQSAVVTGFANLLVATAAGQVSWSVTDGNVFTSVTAYVVNPGNITGLIFAGNSPALERGSFTLSAAASTVVANVVVTSGSEVRLTPTNAAAATLMGSAKSLYTSAITGATSFTLTTASGAAAAGTETFRYVVGG